MDQTLPGPDALLGDAIAEVGCHLLHGAQNLRDVIRVVLEVAEHFSEVRGPGFQLPVILNVLAMEHAGLTAPRLYVASWSGWSADPNRQAATGE